MTEQAERSDPSAGDNGAEQPEEKENPTASEERDGNFKEDLAQMETALGAAEQELAQNREAMLRMQAEMENLRKRLQRDLERSRKYALERIMADLLPVRDSLERGLSANAETATAESLLEGKELILKMLNKAMGEHGLEEIDPLGEAFDPELHEAMTMQPSEEYDENVVMEVLQKGFRLHDRLLRPARVVVSNGPGSD